MKNFEKRNRDEVSQKTYCQDCRRDIPSGCRIVFLGSRPYCVNCATRLFRELVQNRMVEISHA